MKIDQRWLEGMALNGGAAFQMAIGLAPRAIQMTLDILTFCLMFSVALLLLVFGARADETPDRE